MSTPIEGTLQRWEQTQATIKTILHGLLKAVNTSNCALDTSLISEAYDPDFVAKRPYFFQQSAMTFQEYAAGMSELVKSNPGFLVNIISTDIVYVDETHTDAISQIEVHNAPAGTRRQVMAVLRFHLKGDKWLCFTTEAISGFDAEERSSFTPGLES